MTHKNMQVIPMKLEQPGKKKYLTLKNGLEKQSVEITELNESGSVPNLVVINNSQLPLLLIDGEELVGAKQNRIVNATMLLKAESKTIIPVSCTEAGRWAYKSDNFNDSGVIMERKARAYKSARVHFNINTHGNYDANQSEVWNDIDNLHHEQGTQSPTGAMKDAFESKKPLIDEYLSQFPLLEDQDGVMVFINGEPTGFDIVSQSEAYSHLHSKYMKSYVLDALANQRITTIADLQAGGYKFLHQIDACEEKVNQPIGLGLDFRYQKDTFYSSALVFEDEVIHLNGFYIPSAKNKNQFNYGELIRKRGKRWTTGWMF